MEPQNNFDEQLDNLYWSLYHLDKQIEQLKREQLTDLGIRLKGITLDGTVALLLQQACQQNAAQLAGLATIKGKLLAQESVLIRQYLPPAELASFLPSLAAYHAQQATTFSGNQVVSEQSDLLLRFYNHSGVTVKLNEALQTRFQQVFRVPMSHSYSVPVSYVQKVTPYSPGGDRTTLSLQAITRHYFEPDAHARLIELSANPHWFIQLAKGSLQRPEARFRARGNQSDDLSVVTLENVNQAAMRLSFGHHNWTEYAQPLPEWSEPLKLLSILSGALLFQVSNRGNCAALAINPIFALQLAEHVPAPSQATGGTETGKAADTAPR